MKMDRAAGQPLHDLSSSMFEKIQSKVIEQLRGYIAQLCSLVPPDPELVASVSGGSIYEPAILGCTLFHALGLSKITTHSTPFEVVLEYQHFRNPASNG